MITRSFGCNCGVFLSSLFRNWGINIKIILSWVHRQFILYVLYTIGFQQTVPFSWRKILLQYDTKINSDAWGMIQRQNDLVQLLMINVVHEYDACTYIDTTQINFLLNRQYVAALLGGMQSCMCVKDLYMQNKLVKFYWQNISTTSLCTNLI